MCTMMYNKKYIFKAYNKITGHWLSEHRYNINSLLSVNKFQSSIGAKTSYISRVKTQ